MLFIVRYVYSQIWCLIRIRWKLLFAILIHGFNGMVYGFAMQSLSTFLCLNIIQVKKQQ